MPSLHLPNMIKTWFKRLAYLLLLVFILLNTIAAFNAYSFTHFYTGIPPVKKFAELGAGEKASTIFFGTKFPKSKTVDSFNVIHETIKITTIDSMHLESWYA